jgi:hypothetical protein
MRAIRTLDAATPLYHGSHGFRHPLGLYSNSLSMVTERLARVIQAMPPSWTSLARLEEPWERELLECYDHLLDALMEHLDDLGSIMLCFFDSTEARNASAANRQFRSATGDYRTHLGKLDNKIKHHQARLRILIVEHRDQYVPGYFAETSDGQAVGPDPTVHEHGRTAFSFSRDLRLHVVNLIFASQALAEAMGQLEGTPQIYEPPAPRLPDLLLDAMHAIASMPREVYPDEARKPWPQLLVTRDHEGGATVLAELPGTTESPAAIARPFHVTVHYRGDGSTRAFRLPYYGESPARAW